MRLTLINPSAKVKVYEATESSRKSARQARRLGQERSQDTDGAAERQEGRQTPLDKANRFGLECLTWQRHSMDGTR